MISLLDNDRLCGRVRARSNISESHPRPKPCAVSPHAAGCANRIRVAAPEERRCPLCRGPVTGAVRIVGRKAGGLVSARGRGGV